MPRPSMRNNPRVERQKARCEMSLDLRSSQKQIQDSSFVSPLKLRSVQCSPSIAIMSRRLIDMPLIQRALISQKYQETKGNKFMFRLAMAGSMTEKSFPSGLDSQTHSKEHTTQPGFLPDSREIGCRISSGKIDVIQRKGPYLDSVNLSEGARNWLANVSIPELNEMVLNYQGIHDENYADHFNLLNKIESIYNNNYLYPILHAEEFKMIKGQEDFQKSLMQEIKFVQHQINPNPFFSPAPDMVDNPQIHSPRENDGEYSDENSDTLNEVQSVPTPRFPQFPFKAGYLDGLDLDDISWLNELRAFPAEFFSLANQLADSITRYREMDNRDPNIRNQLNIITDLLNLVCNDDISHAISKSFLDKIRRALELEMVQVVHQSQFFIESELIEGFEGVNFHGSMHSPTADLSEYSSRYNGGIEDLKKKKFYR